MVLEVSVGGLGGYVGRFVTEHLPRKGDVLVIDGDRLVVCCVEFKKWFSPYPDEPLREPQKTLEPKTIYVRQRSFWESLRGKF